MAANQKSIFIRFNMEDKADKELYLKLSEKADSSASLTAYVKRALEEYFNSLGKYQIQGRRKEQLYTKDKTALNVILSDCTRLRTFSQYVYGGSIFHS